MIDYSSLISKLTDLGFSDWAGLLDSLTTKTLNDGKHGNLPKWLATLNSLPDITASSIDLNQSWIQIGAASDCKPEIRQELENQLKTLWPWRKGPYNLFGIEIDTEWRSDFKWNRVKPHITPLKSRIVMDVGCGSGYHCWRMEGEGAKLVIGIDPTLVYCFQYLSLQHYIKSTTTFVLPFSTDTLPAAPMAFDTVFSMGVLYHRRSPIDHLTQMWEWLNWEGELVLETLVIEGKEGQILMPENRYAKMRNVWFIPTPDTLELWLRRCNFVNIRCVDINQTSFEEQRVTDWMHFESLADFLDPEDSNKTIEGYPSPKRAVIIANKPEKPKKNLDL
jgi:tRNA (mo5U34)-methyltransferase